jgi:calcineurin-like phosphoesterase family protein
MYKLLKKGDIYADITRKHIFTFRHAFWQHRYFFTTRRCWDFPSVKACDEAIINNWNKTVSINDTVILLGDVGDIESNLDYIKECLLSLNGTIILVLGDRDKDSFNNLQEAIDYFTDCGIATVIPDTLFANSYYCISHKPMYVNSLSPVINIFGHVLDNCMYKTVSERSYCVCPERIKYTPKSFAEIKQAIKTEQNNCKILRMLW